MNLRCSSCCCADDDKDVDILVWFVCRYPDGTYPSVQARNNWWGRNHVSFVAGRIWERRDDDNLIRVEYQPFLPDNTSVLHGTNVSLIIVLLLLLWLSYALRRRQMDRILASARHSLMSLVGTCKLAKVSEIIKHSFIWTLRWRLWHSRSPILVPIESLYAASY